MQDPHHYIHNDPHYCGNKFLLCIHKSWQQIRHGDAHDSRTQNSKAVQKHELVFTLRMSVYLHFCPLDASIERLFFFFVSCTSTSYHLLFWSMLFDFWLGGAATQPQYFRFVWVAGAHGRLCAFRLTCSDSWKTGWTFDVGLLESRFFRQNHQHQFSSAVRYIHALCEWLGCQVVSLTMKYPIEAFLSSHALYEHPICTLDK